MLRTSEVQLYVFLIVSSLTLNQIFPGVNDPDDEAFENENHVKGDFFPFSNYVFCPMKDNSKHFE